MANNESGSSGIDASELSASIRRALIDLPEKDQQLSQEGRALVCVVFALASSLRGLANFDFDRFERTILKISERCLHNGYPLSAKHLVDIAGSLSDETVF